MRVLCLSLFCYALLCVQNRAFYNSEGKGDCKYFIHFSSVSCLFIFFYLDDEFGSYIFFFQMVELKLH